MSDGEWIVHVGMFELRRARAPNSEIGTCKTRTIELHCYCAAVCTVLVPRLAEISTQPAIR